MIEFEPPWISGFRDAGLASLAAVCAQFGDRLPAQTLVPAPKLAVEGMLFEVEAVALLP